MIVILIVYTNNKEIELLSPRFLYVTFDFKLFGTRRLKGLGVALYDYESLSLSLIK